MKKLMLFILFLPAQMLIAQDATTLDQCQNWARENNPTLRQLVLYQQILSLKNENNATAYFPQVNLNGQATYQSDVTKIGLSIPNLNIPTVDKDQYKVFLDLKQTIWDGGLSNAKALVNEAENAGNLQQTEVDLYQLREKVNQFFFTSFLIQENLKILNTKKAALTERKKMIQSAVDHGMIVSSELDQIQAELIKTTQYEIELNSNLETVRFALSILTGQSTEHFQNLKLTGNQLKSGQELFRPELVLFEKQNELLSANTELLKKQRNPKLFGFGQAGYGRPGLNMLNTKFDTYYLIGVGFNWNVLDWKTTTRQQQVIKLQQDLIQTRKETFIQNINLASNQHEKQIAQYTELMKSDQEIIEIRSRITRTSASKLENGSITSADYIQDLNAEIAARLMLETHRIQLEEAKIKLGNIRGNQ
jgi:outer membrane protein TolC